MDFDLDLRPSSGIFASCPRLVALSGTGERAAECKARDGLSAVLKLPSCCFLLANDSGFGGLLRETEDDSDIPFGLTGEVDCVAEVEAVGAPDSSEAQETVSGLPATAVCR